MIQFSKLRIQGFKSFVEATDLPIDAGLTGIVGPNGCGKSNLVEALRWAMGETSAKRLRGGGMADVIFAGTEKRPARNIAEVSISLDNSAHTASASFNSFDELLVSRKIDRDKGSTYRVNGQEVRARDVQLLFTDSATGASSTSLVGQGKLNAIITAKPQDRRILLEEAAGIGGLRTRRHEASLRLKSAEANLERLEGHVADLGARRRDLLRQSRQAEKYRSLSTEIRSLEVQIATLDWIAVALELDENLRALDAAKIAAAEADAALAKANTAFAENDESLAPLRRQETDAAAALSHISIKREQCAAEIVRTSTQHESTQASLAQLEKDLTRETAILEQAGNTVAALKEEQEALEQAAVNRGEELKTAEQQAQEASQNLRQADEALQKLKQQRAAWSSQRDALMGQIAKSEAEVKRRETEHGSWQITREKLAAEMASNQNLKDLEAAVATAQQAFTDAETAQQDLGPKLDEARADEQTQKLAENQAKLALETLRSEISTLERALAAKPKQASGPALAQDIQAPKDLATAVASVLGANSPFGLIDPAATKASGWAALDAIDLKAPDGFQPLAQSLSLPPALGRRFAGIGLADSKEAALAAQNALLPGQGLVTTDGWLISWDGLITSPDMADTTLARRLEQQDRLTELAPQLAPAEAAHAQAKQAVNQASELRAQATKAFDTGRATRQAAQSQLQRCEADLSKVKQSLETQTKRLTSLEAQIDQGAKEIERGKALLEELVAQRAALPNIAQLENEISDADQSLQQARQGLGRSRGKVEELRNLRTRQDERLSAIQRENALWDERASSASDLKNSFAAREAKHRAELDALEQAKVALDSDLETFKQNELDADQHHKIAAQKLKDAEAETDGLKRLLKAAEKTAQEAAGSVIRFETLLESAREKRQELRARIQETHNKTPDGVIAEAGLDVNDLENLPDRDALATRLEQAKSQRAGLGAVNLRAAEEASTLEGEVSTIEVEKAEIEEAISKLRKTISTINKEARARVLEAFEIINQRFGELFTELFGGGKAKLELIDSDDPLEAGLELFAQPPGKKLQSLSLLSGGEQTMSAIALLFSVFLANPAPICVLDEVDAPLDEANVARFCAIVRRLAETTKTRFLMVTHHPVTMARVDRLFGVTMQEKGVSTLVTLDLGSAEELAQVG